VEVFISVLGGASPERDRHVPGFEPAACYQWVALLSSFRECCTANYHLQTNDSIAYVVHRSNAAPGRAVCFLGRFLPKLGGAASAAIFCLAQRPAAAC
jgi:hypothetical protein